ncbi:MAG: hypothetical protein ACW981_00070 [Candidatus Hodarchaeales archaeon]|jgi:hypothetical protein
MAENGKKEVTGEFYKFLTDPGVRIITYAFILVLSIFGGVLASNWYREQNLWYESGRKSVEEQFEIVLPENHIFLIIIRVMDDTPNQYANEQSFISGIINLYTNDEQIAQYKGSGIPELTGGDLPDGFWPAHFEFSYEYQTSEEKILRIELTNVSANFQPIYWIIINRDQNSTTIDLFFYGGILISFLVLYGFRKLILRYSKKITT